MIRRSSCEIATWRASIASSRARPSVLAADAGARPSALVPAAAYVLAGAGMGFAYPRTGVAMLEASAHA